MAGERAVAVFATNLRQLLMQAPMRGQRILGADPGFTSGIKLAAIDECGQLLGTSVVYLAKFGDAVNQVDVFDPLIIVNRNPLTNASNLKGRNLCASARHYTCRHW